MRMGAGCRIAMLLAVALASGCQRQATVEGKVLLDGRPLAEATVSFEPVQAGRSVAAETDAQGHYILTDVEQGENLVRIETYAFRVRPDGKPDVRPEILPPEYHADSRIIRRVEAGRQTFDFQLSSSLRSADGRPH